MSLPAFIGLGFSLPHWTAYVAYAITGVASWMARTSSEAKGVLLAAALLAALSTWLAWDPAFLNWVFSYTGWYGLALHYLVPLTSFSIALPCVAVLLARRLSCAGYRGSKQTVEATVDPPSS